MKGNGYFRKSLSRQVVLMLSGGILTFSLCVAVLFMMLHRYNADFVQTRQELKEKETLLNDIYGAFDTAFLDIRGFIAFDNKEMEKEAARQQDRIREKAADFKKAAVNSEDQAAYSEIINFADYYFLEAYPELLLNYDAGDRKNISQRASQSVSQKVDNFRKSSEQVKQRVESELTENINRLQKRQNSITALTAVLFILFLFLIQWMIRNFLKNIGKPLADFSFAANEIAAGREAAISVKESRQDELGVLSLAFRKMISSVQEKEQDLLAHNEELVAQQDELQAQQEELQATLMTLMDNEQMLKRRNELVNGLSTSLDKTEVLQSIVYHMCRVIPADRGLIYLYQEKVHASFGLSDVGAVQFRTHIDSGLNRRLRETGRPFTVKRQQEASERGFHEGVHYCFDLYIPVTNTEGGTDAIMVFSRYSGPYTEREQEECLGYAKQISISLDKIRIYEHSESARRLNQDILNTVQEGIQLIDKEGRIVQANSKLADFFGCKVKELAGLSWHDWTSLLQKQAEGIRIADMFQASMSDRDEEEPATFIYSIAGTKQVIKVYTVKLPLSGGEIGTVIVHRDITKEYEVDQMKNEFVSTVSHELRTPLASVLGFTELMLNKELKPERRTKYLQTIYNEAKRLTALINDFLDVQRMESGKQAYEKKYIDLQPIIQKTVEHQCINTNIHHIHFHRAENPLFVMGDQEKLEQVFTNLISNAVKYSPEGGTIVINAETAGGNIVVSIQDNGLGIPSEAQPYLFQKFYRVDNTDRRRIGGTGLGLSIVDEIVKVHGGIVTADSEYGKGSIFTVQLPQAPIENSEQRHEPAAGNLNYRIMVIEDDLSLADLLQHELQDSGFEVMHIRSGTAAWDELKKHPPDAVVLDIMLEEGGLDGWELMHKIKDDTELNSLPIFISTALDEKERGYRLGAQDYLVKPYKPSQLSKVIMHTLLSNGKKGQILVPRDR